MARTQETLRRVFALSGRDSTFLCPSLPFPSTHSFYHHHNHNSKEQRAARGLDENGSFNLGQENKKKLCSGRYSITLHVTKFNAFTDRGSSDVAPLPTTPSKRRRGQTPQIHNDIEDASSAAATLNDDVPMVLDSPQNDKKTTNACNVSTKRTVRNERLALSPTKANGRGKTTCIISQSSAFHSRAHH